MEEKRVKKYVDYLVRDIKWKEEDPEEEEEEKEHEKEGNIRKKEREKEDENIKDLEKNKLI